MTLSIRVTFLVVSHVIKVSLPHTPFSMVSNFSTFQLHHAVHNMSKKPLGLFWQFRPSTSNYNDTLYYNLIQDLTIRHKTSDRAERQFTQLLLSDGGQKKPAGKNPVGKKKSAGNLGRNHGSNSK